MEVMIGDVWSHMSREEMVAGDIPESEEFTRWRPIGGDTGEIREECRQLDPEIK